MASASGGGSSGGSPAGSTAGGGGDRGSRRIQIIVAVIAAVAALCVPVVQYLLHQETRNRPAAASGSAADDCGLDQLVAPWSKPDAEAENRQYYAEGHQPQVRVRVGGGDDPAIEVRGQIRLTPHSGQDLVLVRWPDKSSKDSAGHAGSGQYYPDATVEPDSSGCWTDRPRPVGYSGAKGITDVYHLYLMPHAESARLLAGARHRDGYSPKEWDGFEMTPVFQFTVPTA